MGIYLGGGTAILAVFFQGLEALATFFLKAEGQWECQRKNYDEDLVYRLRPTS